MNPNAVKSQSNQDADEDAHTGNDYQLPQGQSRFDGMDVDRNRIFVDDGL
jgi:hypothetical protein